jgi:hypothetical protein
VKWRVRAHFVARHGPDIRDLQHVIHLDSLRRFVEEADRGQCTPLPECLGTLPKVTTDVALSVLAYNLTRVMNIVGTKPLMAAIVV